MSEDAKTSKTLIVTVTGPTTIASIGDGEDEIKFNLHGGSELALVSDLASIADNHGAAAILLTGSKSIADGLRSRGLEVEYIDRDVSPIATD